MVELEEDTFYVIDNDRAFRIKTLKRNWYQRLLNKWPYERYYIDKVQELLENVYSCNEVNEILHPKLTLDTKYVVDKEADDWLGGNYE